LNCSNTVTELTDVEGELVGVGAQLDHGEALQHLAAFLVGGKREVVVDLDLQVPHRRLDTLGLVAVILALCVVDCCFDAHLTGDRFADSGAEAFVEEGTDTAGKIEVHPQRVDVLAVGPDEQVVDLDGLRLLGRFGLLGLRHGYSTLARRPGTIKIWVLGWCCIAHERADLVVNSVSFKTATSSQSA
jgi:hypothetical protein